LRNKIFHLICNGLINPRRNIKVYVLLGIRQLDGRTFRFFNSSVSFKRVAADCSTTSLLKLQWQLIFIGVFRVIKVWFKPYLDGKASWHGLESTILSLSSEGMEILRPGPITEDQLREFGHIVHRESMVKTPGSLPGHYAPRKELSILGSDIMEVSNAGRSGFLAFRQPAEEIAARFQIVKVLSPTGDLREAAANFYSHLRALDESEAVTIYSEALPEEGIGVAIMDRLRRAEYGSKHGTGHCS